MSYQGNYDEALAAYDAVLSYRPNYFPAHWTKCMAQLPIIYSTQQDIRISRKNYSKSLIKLYDLVSLLTPEDMAEAVEVIANHRPFYLAYQCLNDRELQRIYGEMVCRIMHTKYSQLDECRGVPQFSYEVPLRIGIVSGFFKYHSNWKIPIKGWVQNLDKERFKLYGYYTGTTKDQETALARKCFDRFVEDIFSFDTLCRIIKNDRLHVLIYPEIGMDSLTLKLAALRLAPTQCTSWGHPHTSGLSTIDYFLSSELMEPPDADNHYTEKLVRLPNLSVYYKAPYVQQVSASRETLGLRQNAVIYLCSQSLYKYLPQYDEIYPRIARRVDRCQFVFLCSHVSRWVTEQFRSRIRKTFDKFGLRADDYVALLPRLEKEQYYTINTMADVFLDSIEWSGCNSTLEALACNLPVITLPGALMRGRHSSAILTMMGMRETIVSTVDEYVDLAIRLGLDSEGRKQISERIALSKHLVYEDKACITGLEDFLKTVAEERLS